jgi:predicted nuclease of predicted toxin-antitoxin system
MMCCWEIVCVRKKLLYSWWLKIGTRVVVLKLLLDEMYAGLKEYFETLGWNVTTAQDAGLKGAKDKEVVDYARENGMLLITQDQKPADLADLTGVKYVLISNAMIAKIADARIREKYPQLKPE